MANWSDQDKIDRLWKKSFGRARGDNDAQFYEENIPTANETAASQVYAEDIPSIPPSSSNSTIKKWYTSADGRILLSLDRKYNGNRVWVAKDSFDSSFSSGSDDVSTIMKNFVDPRYGPDYVVRVYDENNSQISELDDSSWLFDYRAGVLTFEEDRTESGNDISSCIRIEVFQYIGKMVSTVIGDIENEVSKNYFRHVQGSPASIWNINHNLGRHPSVTVTDSGGDSAVGEIDYVDNNNLRITFSAGFAGEAYLT
jgi:hypothetical protein